MSALSTVIARGTLAARAAAGNVGRVHYATDYDLFYRDNGSSWDAISKLGGTAFPAAPASGDRYWRTDDLLEYTYDGTRWLCTCAHHTPIPPGDAILPLSATATSHRVVLPISGNGIRVIGLNASYFVSGGTALGASHKWVLLLRNAVTAATLATVNIDSGASSAWRSSGIVAVGINVATTEFELEISATKTGTPGSLYLTPEITWRIIRT